jgi:uncharacterized protein YqgC (DUF456 family)
MSFTASVLAVAAMAAALLVVPLGLPGVWVMVAILLVATLLGAMPWVTWVIVAVAAGAAEVGELWLLKTLGSRYGGSRKAFWGAILGGFIGLFLGVPIPLAGSIVAAFLGSFLGAAIVTFLETRSAGHATRVGWGILLARTASVVLKVGTGAVVLAVGAWELLLR